MLDATAARRTSSVLLGILKAAAASGAWLVLASRAFAAHPLPLMAGGYSHVCVSDGVRGNAPYCFSDAAGATSAAVVPPEVKSVSSLAAGAWHTCAVFQPEGSAPVGLTCWGDNRFGQLEVPSLGPGEVPLSVTAGSWHTCALISQGDGRRVACWGQDGSAAVQVPPDLVRPVSVHAELDYTCAVDDQGSGERQIYCWGDSLAGKWPAKTFGVDGAAAPFCEKKGGTVSCQPYLPFDPKNRQAGVSVGQRTALASCWLHAQNRPSTLTCLLDGSQDAPLPLASAAFGLAVGLHRTCVLTADGASCFQPGSQSLTPEPTPGLFFGYDDLTVKTPRDLLAVLQVLASSTYNFDRDFLDQWQAKLSSATDKQLKAVLLALKPYFSNFPYRGIRDQKLANLPGSIDRLLAGSTAEASGDSADRRLFLALLAGAITSERPVLLRVKTQDVAFVQVQEAEQLVADIGTAMAQPDGDLSELKTRLERFVQSTALNSYVGVRAPTLLWLIQHL